MKAYQRGMLVAALAVLAGVVVKVRGKGANAEADGGWRALEGPDFR